MKFEVLVNNNHVVLKNGLATLWLRRDYDKKNSDINQTEFKPEFRLLTSENVSSIFDNFICHGIVYGLIGVFLTNRLVLIRSCISVGRLPFGSHDEVFQIHKIITIALSKGDPIGELGLDKCTQNCCTRPVQTPILEQINLSASFRAGDSDVVLNSVGLTSGFTYNNVGNSSSGTSNAVARLSNSIKATASSIKQRGANKLLNSSGSISNAACTNGGGSTTGNSSSTHVSTDERDRLEKRLVDELHKMFNESSSFYFSWSGDLTNSVQRQQRQKQTLKVSDLRTIPLWKRVDDRFYWNKYMSQQFRKLFDIHQNEQHNISPEMLSQSHIWILPIVQGYVQIERCSLESQDDILGQTDVGETFYWMTLISRRSRLRAGTRYKKRGLDENGYCANYVESEQIITVGKHTVSFVLVRGSVPLFWSQVGHKYRPPPRLERTEPENFTAFQKHFENEFNIYGGGSIAINLIEQQGREKVLADAFLDYALKLDDHRLTYIAFDFHEHCRGMRFENVSILIDRIFEHIKEVRYCWLDDRGTICEQRGVFRVNCVDCLDRTNLVMTAIAKAVMDIQLVRLGILPPEAQLPANSRRAFQLMWAYNGDIISRQYAGTAALKGDFTRTGERKISGVVRDGMNSANRYYMNRFKDSYRQAVIDLMHGSELNDLELSSPIESSKQKQRPFSSSSDQEYHERIKLVIEDCKKILVPEDEVILGGWPLMDADPVTGSSSSPSTSSEPEMDIVLILTKDCYYVADYDDQTDRIVKYQKVLLEDLERIELGAEPSSSYSNAFNNFRSLSSSSGRGISYVIRFQYTIDCETGYFHMFRSAGTRFFNNMAIPICTRDEALESLKAIGESFKIALSVKSFNVPFFEVPRLERRKSKPLFTGSSLKLDKAVDETSSIGHKNRPESSGSRKLLTGMYSHFSRLRGKLTGNGKSEILKSEDAIEMENSESDDSLALLKRKTCSEIPGSLSELDSDYDDSELLSPIREISSPDVGNHKDAQDRLLKSCGILVTSPTIKHEDPMLSIKNKSVLGEIDDFVLDSMKKAQLKQIRQKALSSSQCSLSASTTSIPKQGQPSNNSSRSRSSSTRCVFSSELALNSIVSRTISRDDFALGEQCQSELDLRRKSMNSGSCEMLYEEEIEDDDDDDRDDDDENEDMDDHSLVIHHRTSDPPPTICLSKDLNSSLIKMSRSSTTLQDSNNTSCHLSLNLPSITASSTSLSTNIEHTQTPTSNFSLLVKKEMVLSPLTRIAKGMQSLGLNLRSSVVDSVTTPTSLQISPVIDAEIERRKAASKTRIVLL